MKLPRENVYLCKKNHMTTTVDVADGVTPFMIGCKEPGCQDMAQSSFYPKEPRPPYIPAPRWEWYKPTEKQAKRKESRFPGTLEHVRKGGLLLRERTGAEPVYHSDTHVQQTSRSEE